MKRILIVEVALFFAIAVVYVSAQIPIQPVYVPNLIVNAYVFGIIPSPPPPGLLAACFLPGTTTILNGCSESDNGIDYINSGVYTVSAYDLNTNALYCSNVNFQDFCDASNPSIIH
ncbi:MAG: hypothetical protein AABY16_00420 [Nanoarchaeota archaeon]